MDSGESLDIATKWLETLGSAADADEFAGNFLPTGWLRDLMCFSWDFRTTSGRTNIADFLSVPVPSSDLEVGTDKYTSRFKHAGLYNFQLYLRVPPTTFTVPGNQALQGVSAAFTFAVTSPSATGRGFVRLLQDGQGGSWKAFTLLTNLEDLKGHEEPADGPEGYFGTTWEEERGRKIADIEKDPTVLIIGAGQAGLTCAARFGRMGIRALVVEKTARVGDAWRNRYPNLSLHTPAYHSSVLYQPWPKTFPRFIPKEKIADFLEGYAIGQEIHVWLSSTVLPTPTYDVSTGRWTVRVHRAGAGLVSVAPKHVVFATGNGAPRVPSWPGIDSFKGTLYHSDKHKGAAPFKGMRAVVVGACNAGADICKDFVLKGAAEVTMVQRSATCVISSKTANRFLFSAGEQLAIEDMDFVNHSMPHALTLKLLANGGLRPIKDADKELFDGLSKAGFKLTWELTPGAGEVGLSGFFFDRTASGTMLDMGCGQLIIDGKIKIKQGTEIEKIEKDGLLFADGSKIAADVIVLATGYKPIIANAAAILGDRIRDTIGNKIWGLDEEGELTRCYRPTGAPGIWFTPGAFQHSRFFSKHLALQIKAEELGLKARSV